MPSQATFSRETTPSATKPRKTGASRTARPGKVDAPLDWGRARRMNALETLMWRLEADPHLRAPVCALEVLDRVPDWERFVAAVDWGTRMVPRSRQRVVEPALGLGNPCWVNDPDFDLEYHVSRQALPDGGGWPALLKAAAKAAMTPLDRARSPWESILFTGLPGGRAAHLLKIHHSATDGLGGVQLLGHLHSRFRETNPSKPQPPIPQPERPTPTGLLLQQLRRDAAAVPLAVRRAASSTRHLISPWRTVKRALQFGGSLRRVAAEPGAPGSPLLERRSLTWRFHILDVVFADLKAAAKAADASLNDAFLASLLGAYRLYHEAKDCPIEAMPMAIPISVRRANDAEGGNRFVGARMSAPVGIKDPRERITAIRSTIHRLRHEPAMDALSLLAPVLTRLPGSLLAATAGSMTKHNDLQASNVPGIRDEVYFAGARVERAYGFGPLPGCAAMITLVSHGQTCCVAANVDPAAITDAELFDDCLRRGFIEVLALKDGARPPVSYLQRG